MQDNRSDQAQLCAAILAAVDLELVNAFDDQRVALNHLADHDIDVIVLNLINAEDCEQFIAQARDIDRDIRIVVFLAQCDPDLAVSCFVAGANACFSYDAGVEQVLGGIRACNLGCTTMSARVANHVLLRFKGLINNAANQKGGALSNGALSIDSQLDRNAPYAERDKANWPVDSRRPVVAAREVALSPREQEVLTLIVRGYSNQDIADHLIISLATAKAHVRSILTKLAVSDRTQAAVAAMRQGLV